jgi:hypothetical protein
MKRSALLEQLSNEQFECFYRKNGIDYDYDGSLQNLYLIAENPSTEIQELALPGNDSLSIQLIPHSIHSVITLKFYVASY